MSKFKIELSQKCHDQTYLQAVQAQAPGLKFNFNIPAPKRHNEIRIAVAGDSATQGYGGTTQKQMMAQSLEKRLNDQADGS
jgi:lysophospholipase L1-like esterase